MDKANNKELLQFILESISLIKKRFDGILNSYDFLASDDGLMILDAISMRLQSIGEALKNIEVVIGEWIETAKELGRAIPEPKGKLMYA